MLLKKKLTMDLEIFRRADYGQHTGSCIKHQIHELKDIHEKYGGFPDTYVFQNTMIHQTWWEHHQIDYAALGKDLGIEVKTVSSIKQPPGCVIPWHRDSFYQIKKNNQDLDGRIIVRANVFLEDYRMGHFIQYQETGHIRYVTVTDWQAGDALIWDDQVEHLGANCGFEPKYTLQVSGFLQHD